MKRCPNCQQTFPDNAPDFCPNDGTRMMADAPAPPQYAPGAGYQQPYGAPPQQNWPPPPQPPPQNWSPGGGHYQQAGHAPYAARVGGDGLSKAAMWSGLISFLLTAVFFTIVAIARNSESETDFRSIAQIIYYVMVAAGIIGLVLGIISLAQRGGSKRKGIVGICASLPALAFFVYVIVETGSIG